MNRLEKQLLKMKKKGILVEFKMGVIPEPPEIQPVTEEFNYDVPVIRKAIKTDVKNKPLKKQRSRS